MEAGRQVDRSGALCSKLWLASTTVWPSIVKVAPSSATNPKV